MAAITYINEIAPANVRGALGGAVGILVMVGYVIAGWIGVGFYYLDANFNWRAVVRQLFRAMLLVPNTAFLAHIASCASSSHLGWPSLRTRESKVSGEEGCCSEISGCSSLPARQSQRSELPRSPGRAYSNTEANRLGQDAWVCLCLPFDVAISDSQ